MLHYQNRLYFDEFSDKYCQESKGCGYLKKFFEKISTHLLTVLTISVITYIEQGNRDEIQIKVPKFKNLIDSSRIRQTAKTGEAASLKYRRRKDLCCTRAFLVRTCLMI